MDKNKSRTDLLAAGRKKLQQFRQKKEGKGSKSSGKSGKSERDGDVDGTSVAAGRAGGSPLIPDREEGDSYGASASDLRENELATDVASDLEVINDRVFVASTPEVETTCETTIKVQLEYPVLGEAGLNQTFCVGHDFDSSLPLCPFTPEVVTASETTMDVQLEDPGLGEAGLSRIACEGHNFDSSLAYEGKIGMAAVLDDARVYSSENLASTSSQENFRHAGKLVPVELPASADRVDATESPTVLVELVAAHGEDQVSDVGAMQEGDDLGSKQVDRSIVVGLETDSCLPLSGLRSSAESASNSGKAGMEDVTNEAGKTSEAFDVNTSANERTVGVQKTDERSIALLMEGGSTAVSPEMEGEQREVLVPGSSEEEKPQMASVSDDLGSKHIEGVQVDKRDMMVNVEGSFLTEGVDSYKRLTERKMGSSSGIDVSLISQLAEFLRVLRQEELEFLFKSIEFPFAKLENTCYNAPDSGFSDVLDKLKHELYLINFTKDSYHLQLSEHLQVQMELNHQCHHLKSELSTTNASINEVRGEKESLAGELACCISEVQDVVRAKEEVQKQLDLASLDVEEFSSRVEELQIKLERSQEDLSSISSELADSRGLVAGLQVENEKLKVSLRLMAEERMTVVEEKGVLVLENKELLTELAESKALLASLQLENVNFSADLAWLTEERRKLDVEKEYVFHENEKLLADLADCKCSTEALQKDNANFNGILASGREALNCLEKERVDIIDENLKLSTELMAYKGVMEGLQVEISYLNGNFRSVAEERDKLWEEKKYIATENERQSIEIANLEGVTAGLQVEYGKVESDLKEATLCLEQLLEENAFLRSSLDLHKDKLTEFDRWQLNLSSRDQQAGDQVEGSNMPSPDNGVSNGDDSNLIPGEGESKNLFLVLEKPSSECHSRRLPVNQFNVDAFDDSCGLTVLKGHLEDAEKVLEKLETAIEGMHAHSAFLSRSSGKLVAPGVSKLIQAFESKVHSDDHDLEESSSSENRSVADSYTISKEQTGNLRIILKELCLDVQNVCESYKGGRNSKIFADVAVGEYEYMKEHCSNLEEANIELVVLNEAVRQHMFESEAMKREVVVLCESLKLQDTILKAENSELRGKLMKFQARVDVLCDQMDQIHVSLDEMVSFIYNQVETLQKEVIERVEILEQEHETTVGQVVETVRKLDTSIETVCSSDLPNGIHDSVDVCGLVTASVMAATKVIADLQDKLKEAHRDHEAICSSYKDVQDQFNDLNEKNGLAIDTLHKIHDDLKKLVSGLYGYVEESEALVNEKLLDPLDSSTCDTILEQLRKLFGERLHLESMNNKLNSELTDRTKDLDELNKRCIAPEAILGWLEDVKHLVGFEDIVISTDEPAACIENVITFLAQKCKEADEQHSLSRREVCAKDMELSDLQAQVDRLSFLIIEYETEILIFKESLRRAMEECTYFGSELQEKAVEVEQSELRVSSLREKLGIAVAKGKGLIMQRDSLKQSLARMSGDLEKCSHDLQSKDARVLELETKLKTYSEAGERVEALESELSYIRNSATALRESFLLKDSVLQRIEEILEDVELPEHFHSRDIIQKVDMLARSVTRNSLSVIDSDKKSSVAGSSYDANFVVMDAWKEDAQPNSNSGEDLRRKYEDLQGKFYGLAEQNEMLEQSLVERNNLVQQWEEILDRIDIPSQLRSIEPEDRIEWLAGAFLEAQSYCDSLQRKIDNLETFCRSLTASLDESQRKTSDLEEAFELVTNQKELLSQSLETLDRDHVEVSQKAAQFEADNDELRNELCALQEKLDKKLEVEEHAHQLEDGIRRLENLVGNIIQDPGTKYPNFGFRSTEYLEIMITKLIEKYTTLHLETPIPDKMVGEHDTEKGDATHGDDIIGDSGDEQKQDVMAVKEMLDEALGELTLVKEERDTYMEKTQSLVHEVEALNTNTQGLQNLLDEEQQKSASMREKLNLAVRKGKSLVQQRESLKQNIEEVNMEVERLKSERKLLENVISEYEKKIKDLSTYHERVEAMESEYSSLKNHFEETEYHLQEKEHLLSMILNALDDIGDSFGFNVSDPVGKLKGMGKLCHDLRTSLDSEQHESKKAKRTAELLLEELNEVQERNDVLQVDLAEAGNKLSELSNERDLAEASKFEALRDLEKLSVTHSEERNNQLAEVRVLKSSVDKFNDGFYAVKKLLADVLFKDLEFLDNLEVGIRTCLKENFTGNFFGLPIDGAPHSSIISTISGEKGDFSIMDSFSVSKFQEDYKNSSPSEFWSYTGHYLQSIATEFGSLKEKINTHSYSVHQKANCIFELLGAIHREMINQKQSFESMKNDIIRLKSFEKEKDKEMLALQRNISLLFEACASSILEIENWKANVVGKSLATETQRINLESQPLDDGGNSLKGQTLLSSEEFVKDKADNLLLSVKNFIDVQAGIVDVSQKEMKTTILNLQNELLEKDVEKDRICMELVSQIKEAEAAARNYLHDLLPANARIHELERRLNVLEEENVMLESKVKEHEDWEATSMGLQERVKLLTEAVAAKEQEIEALMQALDEEEAQMEDMTNKIAELERALQEKIQDLENLEAARGKAVKKLSVAMNKFDELHHFSVNLLSEVEKLQSQLQDQDAEISFLRQEVTRCTNDTLVASQKNDSSDEIHDLLTWLQEVVSRGQVDSAHFSDRKNNHEYKEILQKQIMLVVSELEDLRVLAQNKELLLQTERRRVEELIQKEEFLENSLRDKEFRLNMVRPVGDSRLASTTDSEIIEVDPVINKRTVPRASMAHQVRSWRKPNNDQVSISVDMDPGSDRLEEDDDKAHGFKSLATSKLVPRFTRPVTDMIDGLWVSCDRALMRQPTLRLSMIIYWIVAHFLFTSFIF